jgi:hypothetical protein
MWAASLPRHRHQYVAGVCPVCEKVQPIKERDPAEGFAITPMGAAMQRMARAQSGFFTETASGMMVRPEPSTRESVAWWEPRPVASWSDGFRLIGSWLRAASNAVADVCAWVTQEPPWGPIAGVTALAAVVALVALL